MKRRVRALARSTRCGLIAVVCLLSLGLPAAAQQAVSGGGGWIGAADAAGDNTYEGFVDQPASGSTAPQGTPITVSGWVVDTTADGWAGIDGIEVLLGSTVLTHGVVGLSRPDVAAATGNPYWASSGFSATVPGGAVPAGAQTLTVRVHTPGKGSWGKQVTVNVSGGGGVITSPSGTGIVLKIVSPGLTDLILANHNGIINGVAYDTGTRPELGVGVSLVQAYIDGVRGIAGSHHLGDAIPAADTTWSITWQPTNYDSVKHHILYVYAHSSVTGQDLLVTEEINIVACPTADEAPSSDAAQGAPVFGPAIFVTAGC